MLGPLWSFPKKHKKNTSTGLLVLGDTTVDDTTVLDPSEPLAAAWPTVAIIKFLVWTVQYINV